MHTTINSNNFDNKIKGKYNPEFIDSIIEKLSHNPRIGKKFTAVNNVFKLDIGPTINKKYEYTLVYYYFGKNTPIFVINIFKKREKDLLSKIIDSLVFDKNGLN